MGVAHALQCSHSSIRVHGLRGVLANQCGLNRRVGLIVFVDDVPDSVFGLHGRLFGKAQCQVHGRLDMSRVDAFDPLNHLLFALQLVVADVVDTARIAASGSVPNLAAPDCAGWLFRRGGFARGRRGRDRAVRRSRRRQDA